MLHKWMSLKLNQTICIVIVPSKYYQNHLLLISDARDTVTYTRDSVLFDMSGFTLQMAARLDFRNI